MTRRDRRRPSTLSAVGLCLLLAWLTPPSPAAELGAVVHFSSQSTLPRVLGGTDNRVLLGPGDTFLADGLEGRDARRYHVLRPDPIAASQTARVLGEAVVIETRRPAILRIQRADREIRPGDYLVADTGADHPHDD